MPKFTARDGQRLNYFDIGKGPLCILIHGFGMQASMWLPLILPLSRQYRFILPDLRGFGGSATDHFAHDNVFDQYAHDLADLMDVLGEERVTLAGFSMGGTTSMHYQRLYGTDKLLGYLQIDQSHRITNHKDWRWGLFGEEQDEIYVRFHELLANAESLLPLNNWTEVPAAVRDTVLWEKAEFVASAFAYKPVKQGVRALHRLGLSHHLMPPASWAAFVRCIRAYISQHNDYSDVFDNYSVPFSVFAGTDSELYPVEGQRQLAETSNGRLVEFKGCGHCLAYERPIQFMRELSTFIRHAYASPEALALS